MQNRILDLSVLMPIQNAWSNDESLEATDCDLPIIATYTGWTQKLIDKTARRV